MRSVVCPASNHEMAGSLSDIGTWTSTSLCEKQNYAHVTIAESFLTPGIVVHEGHANLGGRGIGRSTVCVQGRGSMEQ